MGRNKKRWIGEELKDHHRLLNASYEQLNHLFRKSKAVFRSIVLCKIFGAIVIMVRENKSMPLELYLTYMVYKKWYGDKVSSYLTRAALGDEEYALRHDIENYIGIIDKFRIDKESTLTIDECWAPVASLMDLDKYRETSELFPYATMLCANNLYNTLGAFYGVVEFE